MVRARLKTSAASFTPRAQAIAAENNLYPAWLEQLWRVYEGGLPHAADQLENRRPLSDDDKECLLMHVAALKPRTSSFLDDLNEYQAELGLPPFTEHDLPLERARAFIHTLPYAMTWRWRVLYPGEKESFVINDRGLCEFSDPGWPGKGVFFPLGPTVGILGFLHLKERHRKMFRPTDFSDDIVLNRGHASILNRLAWQDANRFVIARHDEQQSIEELVDALDISYDLNGPYRFRRFGWFAD
jgi:hypothetical protein